MRRFLDRLYDAAGVAAAVAMVAICVLMLAQAAGREAGIPIRGADDIVAWLCAACAFLALGHTFRHGDLVRVGVFLDRLPERLRWHAELFALTVSGLFVAVLDELVTVLRKQKPAYQRAEEARAASGDFSETL
ncbi:MAG: TRAP transporter small permease [Betaproteobacteria bacterium]|nr:TRAP transporter small permease [Betaproteobacteria bacterium]